MKIPKVFPLKGEIITVGWADRIIVGGEEAFGSYCEAEDKIMLLNSLKKNKPKLTHITLHEINHAILHHCSATIAGLSDEMNEIISNEIAKSYEKLFNISFKPMYFQVIRDVEKQRDSVQGESSEGSVKST